MDVRRREDLGGDLDHPVHEPLRPADVQVGLVRWGGGGGERLLDVAGLLVPLAAGEDAFGPPAEVGVNEVAHEGALLAGCEVEHRVVGLLYLQLPGERKDRGDAHARAYKDGALGLRSQAEVVAGRSNSHSVARLDVVRGDGAAAGIVLQLHFDAVHRVPAGVLGAELVHGKQRILPHKLAAIRGTEDEVGVAAGLVTGDGRAVGGLQRNQGDAVGAFDVNRGELEDLGDLRVTGATGVFAAALPTSR